MPFLITEPQKIDGTQLGFAIYPYHFSFNDYFGVDRKVNQKLTIFKMKDSQFVEIERPLFEYKFKDDEVPRNYVDALLKNFITKNPQYVINYEKVKGFFAKGVHSNKDDEKVFQKP